MRKRNEWNSKGLVSGSYAAYLNKSNLRQTLPNDIKDRLSNHNLSMDDYLFDYSEYLDNLPYLDECILIDKRME